ESTDARSRGVRIDFDRGSELYAPVWAAVTRVRDIVAKRAEGTVRLAPTGPEGGLAVSAGLASLTALRETPTSRASAARGESVEPGLTLCGTNVLVADDDPAVTWFLAGVLRAAGATVHELHDGASTLDAAYRTGPDLVITDLVMPGLDGFALCRAIKRDVVLRDVPVLLLSWKEDLLQRVREIGAGADGYLRKEASALAIVQRAREVLRPRHRVGSRLEDVGEVRGRLDGVTTTTLLRLVGSRRPTTTLWVRDPRFSYEIRVADGAPTHARGTALDGRIERGPAVLRAMLGVGAGRFVVSASEPRVGGAADPREVGAAGYEAGMDDAPELDGSLETQLAPLVAAARGAQRLLG